MSDAQMRSFDVPIEMGLLFVLFRAPIARILPFTRMIPFVDQQVAPPGEFLVATRLVALDSLAQVQRCHVGLQRRVLREAF